MIIHRTNVAAGHRGLAALLHLLTANRRATRWQGCTPTRTDWESLRPQYLRARQHEAEQAAVASIRHTRSWPNTDPRVAWTALYGIRRAIAKARATSPTATAQQSRLITPSAGAVAAFPSQQPRAA